jgi:hypothetical protein
MYSNIKALDLDQVIIKNGYKYIQLKKGNKAFLYARMKQESNFINAYEVFPKRIRHKRIRKKGNENITVPASIKSPYDRCTETWVNSFSSLGIAQIEYAKLEYGEHYYFQKNKKILLKEYASCLDNLDWNSFVTLTTSYELTKNSARRLMDIIKNDIGKDYIKFWILEPFNTKSGCHIHFLLKLPVEYTDNKIKELWNKISRGKTYNKNNEEKYYTHRADIKPRDYNKGAGYYLTKHIGDKLADYDFS